nr:MAG TPA: hypothetical protein [Caudoviricetes sp.]
MLLSYEIQTLKKWENYPLTYPLTFETTIP